MSAKNGDKARFGRWRKQKIARRVRTRAISKQLAAKVAAQPAPAARH